MNPIDELLANKPYELDAATKRPLFLAAMKVAFQWHTQANRVFAEHIADFNFEKCQRVEDLPFLPVEQFKHDLLMSVDEGEVVRIVESSGTSGSASSVALDEVTIARQQRALSTILTNYVGNERKHFIVFDNKKYVRSVGKRTSSRASGLQGMTLFAKSMHFVLDENLDIDEQAFAMALKRIPEGAEICVWGFTWMLHEVSKQLPNHESLLTSLRDKLASAESTQVLHVGGWKQLESESVGKAEFNSQLASALGIDVQCIVDVYGMTEHLGTVYLDDEYGLKSVSAYSDVIIRDTKTLAPLPCGEVGRIQLLTPIPHSYPGVSILTTDLGRIEGIDNCPTGRPGKYFTFQGRYREDPK